MSILGVLAITAEGRLQNDLLKSGVYLPGPGLDSLIISNFNDVPIAPPVIFFGVAEPM
jgi:hypothetical protein